MGKYCVVDTFLYLEKFYDSIDNVKLKEQASQLKWNPVVLYMSLLGMDNVVLRMT